MKVGQENRIFLLTPSPYIACAKRHGGPGAHVKDHRLALGKEETLLSMGGQRLRLRPSSGGQVQKWKGTNLLPHILERETFKRRKYSLQITWAWVVGQWPSGLPLIHCSWPESQRLSCPPCSPHQLFREIAKL